MAGSHGEQKSGLPIQEPAGGHARPCCCSIFATAAAISILLLLLLLIYLLVSIFLCFLLLLLEVFLLLLRLAIFLILLVLLLVRLAELEGVFDFGTDLDLDRIFPSGLALDRVRRLGLCNLNFRVRDLNLVLLARRVFRPMPRSRSCSRILSTSSCFRPLCEM